MENSSSPSPFRAPARPTLTAGLLCLLLALWAVPAAANPKTDVITLINGDIVTCEIKEMVRGKVRAQTDHMGTVYIEWDKIAHLVSNYWFLVTLRDGSLIYGQMAETSENGVLEISFQERSVSIPLGSVVEIQPIQYDLWDRFDISTALGINWNKGSQVLQSNFDFTSKYKGKIYSYGLEGSWLVTDRGEGEIFRRNDADLWLGREISGRLHGNIDTGIYRNDELGLRMRYSGGANLGYYLVRGSHVELRALVGASLNREWANTEAEPTNNSEGRIGTEFSIFYYDTPKSDIAVSANLYPNFTVSDRYRFEGSISGRQEIIKDLFIKLEYYESRDSKPPAGAGGKEDRGLILSIEWTK